MPIPTSSLSKTAPKQASPFVSDSWKPWLWWFMSQTTALNNARDASIELARARVARNDVDIFIDRLDEARRLGRVSTRP